MSVQVCELVSGLKSRHSEIRRKSVRELYHFAKADLREMPQDAQTQLLDEFNQQIHSLISSYDNNDKKAGIFIIVCLIGGDTENTKTRTLRYANYLKNIFPSSDVSILELAAKTMGRLAMTLGVKRGEFVESEIKQAFEWLSEERNEGKRLSATLILLEMAITMPSFFYQQINGFFDHIMVAIRDPKEQIREKAGRAMRAAFEVAAQRENPKQPQKAHWYIQSYEEAITSFSDLTIREKGLSRDDHIHGALLILNELLRCANAGWERKYTFLMQKLDSEQDIPDEILPMNMKSSIVYYTEDGTQTLLTHYESSVCRQLVTENYEKICTDVMAQQISRSLNVHQLLLLLVPRLAAFNREAFTKKHLKSSINHLITCLRGREKEKVMAFTTLGLVAVAVESDIQQYLNRIFEVIKISFSNRDTPKKRQTCEASLFDCITLLGFALKENISNELKELLELMCATGLSLHLTTCFRELSKNVPSLRNDITERLLNMLSIILRKKPYTVSGSSSTVDQHMAQLSLYEPNDASKLVLALRTLGTFDFEWQNILMSFIRRCTDHYLQSDHQEVRLEAVRTAAKLLMKAINKTNQSRSQTLNTMIDDAIGKLLEVGLTDFDNEVRYWVFEIFIDTAFDMYLVQEENLDILLVAVNDENSDVRELAMAIIGRLSSIIPSYINPSLMQMYVQFMTEIQHCGMSWTKEQAIRMLGNLILYAPAMSRPYVNTILNVLVPTLTEEASSSGVVISTLKAIGDLCDVNGDGTMLNKWLPELSSLMFNLISDANASEKRNVALWSFGQLISATGYVFTPYMDYPNLMDILLGFLKTEQNIKDRREIIRVLGLLGALDPYRYRANQSKDIKAASILIPITINPKEDDEADFETNASEILVNMSPLVLDEFYPAIVVTSLMSILRDTSLSQHHTSVVHSITFIFHSLGIKCVPYISRVMPSLLYVIRQTENDNFREFLFTQLAQLISIVKVHIRDDLPKIFDLIREYWTPASKLQSTLVMLVDQIASAIGPEFKVYLIKIMPNILRALHNDTSKDKFVTEKLLSAIQKLENNLDDVLQLITPAVTRLFDCKDVPTSVSKLALETIEHLALYVDFGPFASSIIHPLVRVIDTNSTLRTTAMNALCALVIQMGRDYNVFVPAVDRVLRKHRVQCINYLVLVSRLESASTLASDDNYLYEARLRLRTSKREVVQAAPSESIQKLTVNVNNLRRCWDTSGRLSKDDWLEWLRRLSVALLSESHSPAIRACSTLAQNYSQLATDLFNAAFMSCWTELNESARKECVCCLEQALNAEDAPEIALTVLNLVEFMEHCDRGSLPISVKLLGDRAISCRAYAKALYYKEHEYKINPTSQVVEALIHINKKLQQREAANGLLEMVMMQRRSGDFSLNIHVRWYEKLHNWDQALDLYKRQLKREPGNNDARLGQMRCLEALGEWEILNHITKDLWENMDDEMKKKSAKIAAAASWGHQQWDSMKTYVELIPENTQDGSFYRAILAVHESQWAESRYFVDQARTLLDAELTAVAGESYQRAYCSLVNAQLLYELEEVVSYKLVEERRSVLRHAWWARLQGAEKVLEDWRKLLQVRSLVMSPGDDIYSWLKYASLCRKSGSLTQAQKVLTTILGKDPIHNHELILQIHDPRIALTHTKNLWCGGEKRFAFELLHRFLETVPGSTDEDHCRLLSRCHLKLGAWCEYIQEINDLSIPEILRNYVAATVLTPDWYKAWHAWAYMNFEAVLYYKQEDNLSECSVTGSPGERKYSKIDVLHQYIIPAVEGFFKSINLSNGNSLQDTLRLLTLWFDYGHHTVVYEALFEGVRRVEVDTWLQVVPQLISRIDSPRALVAKLVHSVLVDVGKAHPQALVYPLTVASKSNYLARKTAAIQLLKTMSSHSHNLVMQAAIISEELIRVAILWHDQWFIALDEASRLYFSEKDTRGMLKCLEPMHAMISRGAQTLKEENFLMMYGQDLNDALMFCNRYQATGDDAYLNEAWDLYWHVFRRIAQQFRGLSTLELQYVSPRLLECRDMDLAVPGSYMPNQEPTRISYIHSYLKVIKSKQQPRQLTIHGSDGKDYMFLLKGHEDLRQDERAMQLFGLVNTLLKSDSTTYRQDLAIQRYGVIPLSTNSGLIGWVPQCDTLYDLISDYREKKSNKVSLNAEHQMMTKISPDFQKLMLMQKVDIFEHTLSQTPSNDLARLLWLKSSCAEVWFERRNNYTRSLAVMSMVGYILGLGDRHPSNIMLHRVTGKVLHIDFGDCFEVTLTREKFPEKIPFRLTRMLVNAMEVTGIEGTYRSTCQLVMEVMHKNKDSVLSVLEAFVYDPLMNWRLIERQRSMTQSSLCSSDPDSPSTLPSRSRHHLHMHDSIQIPVELNQNKQALTVVNRIRDKLTGRDFPKVQVIVNVQRQIELLIEQAMSNENLCQCYIGWCPFW